MTSALARRQRGISLIEALVGLLLLSVGLMGALRLQTWLRLHGDIAHQRSEAVRLAQQDLEGLRGFAQATAFDAITSQHRETNGERTAFVLTRSVAPSAGLKSSQVNVQWVDRSGGTQTVQLHASIAAVAPVYSAALSLPSQDRVFAPRRVLPAGARHFTEGRSVFKPSNRSALAWIIDNATGLVVARCSAPTGLAARDITAAHLESCTDMAGMLLHGYIRFSLGPSPDAAEPNDVPLALSLTPTDCEIEASTGREHHLAYVCFIPTGTTGSQPLRMVPEGWAFGATASTFKACRYSGAPNNYLVIRGDASCPATSLATDTQHNEASFATVQYQP
ncbi:MAG TPA: prepilin-type N-terminal cleavage/methylation domain-containing protein [Rhizobacter sp.]|nr:prepilin-type N-terminal cleavage/methylation domain-containing protein [Rhizobacter sp.]